MSWWDSFTNYVKQTVLPFWGITGAGTSTKVTAGLAQSLAYQQYGYKGQVGQAMAQEVGRQVGKGRVESAIAEGLFTPGRELRSVIQTPFQAIASGQNISEAYSLVRGDRSKVKWYEPGKEGISFAQSVYGGLSALVPGEQAVDRIDWTNNKEVRDYFSNGPAKYITGGIDAVATLGIDPLVIGGVAAGRVKVKYFSGAIRNDNDLVNAITKVDEAVAGQRNYFSPIIDFVMKFGDDESTLYAHRLIYDGSTSEMNLAAALASAGRKGDKELVGDILKVSMGDIAAQEKLLARKDTVSAAIAKIKLTQKDIIKTSELYGETEYIKGLKDNLATAIGKLADEEQTIIRVIGRTDTATGEPIDEGLMFTLSSTTVSRWEKAEFWRAQAAEKRAKTMYDEQYVTVDNIPVRVATWINPSGPIKEQPSGMFSLGTAGQQSSWREMTAQARELSKITKKDYRGLVNQWTRLFTKEERYDYLTRLETRMITDIIDTRVVRSRFPQTMTQAEEEMYLQQLAATEMFVAKLVATKPRIQNRVYNEIKRNNYVIFDEKAGDPVVVKELKTALEKIAKDENITYESLIDNLAEQPALGSQAANIYHFMDVKIYDDVINENKSTIRHFLDLLDDELYKADAFGDQLTAKQQKNLISNLIDDILVDPKAGLPNKEKYVSIGTEFYNGLVSVADAFHGSVWKPLTIISLKYTARNVAEAWTRTGPALYQLALESGDSTFRALGDFVGNPLKSISNTVNNLVTKRNATKKLGEVQNLSTQARLSAMREDAFVVNSTKNMETGLATLRMLAERVSTIKDPSGKKIKQLQNWLKSDSKLISSIKNSEVRRFVIMLLDGDVDDAIKLIQATDDVSTLANDLAGLKNQMLKIADSFEEPLTNGTYSSYLGKDSVELISNYQKTLVDTAELVDRVIVSRANSAAAWQEFDKLIIGTNPILRQKDDGTFEVMKGVSIPDWGAGQLGTYAKKDAAADTTYFNTIQAGNRLIGESIASRHVVNAVVDGTSKNWANSFTRFVNEDLRSDALMYRIINSNNNPKGATDDALLELLKSRDMKGYRILLNLDKKSDERLLDHINAMRLFVEYYLPELPNMKPGYLKDKVAAGILTQDEVIRDIPQNLRATVSGEALTQNKLKGLFYYWNKGISETFKYIGSLPETVLARHPFYRSAYRMEARRVARLLDGQGADITSSKYQNIIVRAAHKKAYKELNQTLYTVIRRSEFAQTMRFVSPFYMANQNAQRFWAGATFKNPALPQLGLIVWNTPNKVLEVVDREGNPVESSLPFFSDEAIYITLPESIAKFIGQDYVYFYKTSFDLVTNGALPIIPQASGALVSLPATVLFKEVNIGKYATDLGYDGDFIEEKITPYLDPYRSPLEQILPSPAWYRAFLNWRGDTPQAASRTNLIAEQAFMEADLNGVTLSNEDRANIIKESAETARKTFFTEMAFALGVPFVAAPKFTVSQDLLKKEYRRYIKRYGNVNGAVRFEQDFGTVKNVYASSSLSDNPGGLLATPQTLNNLKTNMKLAEEIAASDKFGDDGFSILGLLFNEGDPTDYSGLVNSQFYSLKIAGRTLKQQNEDLAAAQRKNEISIGWRNYIPFKNMAIAIAESRGVKVGSLAWDTNFKPLIDAKVAEIAAKYPAWYTARGQFDTNRSTNVFYALSEAINSKEYMRTTGKRNQVALALKEWIPFRNSAAMLVKRRGMSISSDANADVRNLLEIKAAELSAKYPEFTLVHERFLANDSLELRN